MKRWIPLLALGAALAGCGTPAAGGTATGLTAPAGGSASADPHPSWDTRSLPDPCRTLTTAEIDGLLGGATKPGVRLESWPPLCQYVLDAQRREYLYVSDDSAATGKPDYDRKRVGVAQAVTGIGDEAYWLPETTSLHVMAGATHVNVAFAGPVPPDGAQDKAVALARLVLGRART